MKDLIPRKDSEFMEWIENFVKTIEPFYDNVGLNDEDFEQMKQHVFNYNKILEVIMCLKIKSKQFTDFKNKLRNGKKIKVVLTVPSIDVKVDFPGEILPGVEKRFRNFIKRIKAHPNYTKEIGIELRI